MQATVETTVGASDTAAALGSGDVEVLGTPAVVALCEAAAVKAIADRPWPTTNHIPNIVEYQLGSSDITQSVQAKVTVST